MNGIYIYMCIDERKNGREGKRLVLVGTNVMMKK